MKVKTLYHASSNKNIEILEPKADSIRDPNEGPVVFASHDKVFVTCFLVPTNDNWTKISRYRSHKHPTIHVMSISDEKRFKELDKGGAIYHMSSKGFYLDKSKSDIEWTSKVSVRPFKKELYNSGLNAMIENGVIVYFCDRNTLLKIKEEPWNIERVMRIYKGLVSENEKRGLENIIQKYY
ncbi:MAG: hypothetical protein ACOX0X_02845 [Candidatus Dojkabacteria bacterium]